MEFIPGVFEVLQPSAPKERMTALEKKCAIKMENITKRFGSKVIANKDVNLDLYEGEIHVFDCSTFTTKADDTMNAFKVDYLKLDEAGHITSYMADVDTDQAYTGDTEVVHDGYFAESEKRSAPYFDLEIDGITRLDTKM